MSKSTRKTLQTLDSAYDDLEVMHTSLSATLDQLTDADRAHVEAALAYITKARESLENATGTDDAEVA